MKRDRGTKLTMGILLFALAPFGVAAAAEVDLPLLPPDARPGECYTRVWVAPSYRTSTEQVLVREASEKLSVVPADYQWVEKQVPVKEASQRMEMMPATYEWVEEQVLVKPESVRIEQVPASYEKVTEKILDQPAHTVWKEGRGPIQKVDDSTGEIMCLVEVPASYKTVTKTVLKSPPTTREVTIPAEYKTVKKQVMVKPPTSRLIDIPAEYKTVKVRTEAAPSRVSRTPIPEEYKTITRTEKVTDGHMQWQSVLCQTNASKELVLSLQRSLKSAGFDPGPIDGIIGTETMNAVSSYQKAKGLPTGGITTETLEKLGVRYASR